MTDQPTAVEQIVSEITHTGTSEYIGAAQLVSVRLHLNNFTALQAMTAEAGVSRSQMHNHLVAAGIEAVMAALPEDAVMRIEQGRNSCLQGLIHNNALQSYSEEDKG